MSEAYTVYLRSGEKVLLMQRSDEVSDFPGAWDGIHGIGDPNDHDSVVARITNAPGFLRRVCNWSALTCKTCLRKSIERCHAYPVRYRRMRSVLSPEEQRMGRSRCNSDQGLRDPSQRDVW